MLHLWQYSTYHVDSIKLIKAAPRLARGQRKSSQWLSVKEKKKKKTKQKHGQFLSLRSVENESCSVPVWKGLLLCAMGLGSTIVLWDQLYPDTFPQWHMTRLFTGNFVKAAKGLSAKDFRLLTVNLKQMTNNMMHHSHIRFPLPPD